MNINYSKYSLANGMPLILCSDADAIDSYSLRIRNGWTLEANVLLASYLLKPNDFFLDFGANVGCFSAPLALLSGASGVAVEALPQNVLLLQECIATNKLDIKIVSGAVLDEDAFVFIEGSSAYGHLSSQESGVQVRSYKASSIIDLHKADMVKLIKIDIEGAELRCLNGSPLVFQSEMLRHVIFEANGPLCLRNGYMPQDLIKFFEELNYSVYLINGRRLDKRTSRDFQEFGNCDYIATKDQIDTGILPNYTFDPIKSDRKIAEVVNALVNMKPQYRKFMLHQLDLIKPDCLGAPSIVKAIGAAYPT